MLLVNYGKSLRAFLIAIIVACSLWIGYVAVWNADASVAQQQPAAQKVTLHEMRLAPEDTGPGVDLAEMTAQPLFDASRSPPPSATATESAKSSAQASGQASEPGMLPPITPLVRAAAAPGPGPSGIWPFTAPR